MRKKFKWEVGDDIVNFHNYKARIEERLIDEQGLPCYLVSSNEEQDYEIEKKWILKEEEVMCLEEDYEGQDCENVEELTDEDNAELGRLITSGVTSGRLDNDDCSVIWSLDTLKWRD
jgi:hypothetical protein